MPGSADSITGTSNRGTCWSLTINNPIDSDYKLALPPNWKLTGQLEQGEKGTLHYQGMLQTPQVRFAAVKKQFPRAHIELARNKAALSNYVHKNDTRVGNVSDNNGATIPTLFDYQHTVARAVIESARRFAKGGVFDESDIKRLDNDVIMSRVNRVVQAHIEEGQLGIEYIAINPMWISAWKKFGSSMLVREYKAMVLLEKHNADQRSCDDASYAECCEEDSASLSQEEDIEVFDQDSEEAS